MVNLPVYFEQRLVGRIDADKNGPAFTYDPDWVALRGSFPISITMPLKTDRIASDVFLPRAANLLPEASNYELLGNFLDYRGLTWLGSCPRSAAILPVPSLSANLAELPRFNGDQ